MDFEEHTEKGIGGYTSGTSLRRFLVAIVILGVVLGVSLSRN